MTRGILIDAPFLRGVEVIEPGDGVGLADLERAQQRCGVEPEPGDVLLLRTGSWGVATLLDLFPRMRARGPLA